MNRESRRLAAWAAALLLLGVAVKFSWDWISPVSVNSRPDGAAGTSRSEPGPAGAAANPETAAETATAPAARPGPGQMPGPEVGNLPLRPAEPGPVEPASRFRAALDSESVHFNEAVVLLKTSDGYQSFLAHAGANATGKIPEILAVRVRAATVREIDAMIDTAFP